ncbi:MAG: MFS transporter, partial [Gluconobacter cerinus]
LRTILIMLFIIGAFGLNFPIFIATMAVGVFHVGAHGYGILNSAMAVGTILGGFLAAGRKKADFDVLLNGSLIFGVGCLLGALAPTYWLFACTLLITGVSSLTFTATSNSFMQLSSDPSMRGRVLAIRFAVFAGSSPFGAPVVGWVANYFGPRWSLGVGALSGFLAAVVALLYILRMREQQGEKHS